MKCTKCKKVEGVAACWDDYSDIIFYLHTEVGKEMVRVHTEIPEARRKVIFLCQKCMDKVQIQGTLEGKSYIVNKDFMAIKEENK